MRVELLLWILLCLACRSEPTPSPSAVPAVPTSETHPPIPADDPSFQHDPGGFVANPRFYGEASWDDVRMRLAGHLGVIGRDRARWRAEQGDLPGAASAYRELALALAALSVGASGPGSEIRAHLVAAAQRDAALCEALAEGRQPAPAPGFAGLRARVLGLALREEGSIAPEEARELREDLREAGRLDPTLHLDAFQDFQGRHRLRVRLWEAALGSIDPLGFSDPWGYWEPQEQQRQALLLRAATSALAGLPEAVEDAAELSEELRGTQPELAGLPRIRWAGLLGRAFGPVAPGFSAEGLGGLPTGDSLIDVGAQPGPRAIGRLSRLGLDDAGHRSRLEEEARALQEALARDPAEVGPRVERLVVYLDAFGHTSRYYNIKQARNEAVRQLALAQRPDLALEVLRRQWPLAFQDWACPNREGILLALEARLLAVQGSPEAPAAIERAWQASQGFLERIAEVERQPPPGPR